MRLPGTGSKISVLFTFVVICLVNNGTLFAEQRHEKSPEAVNGVLSLTAWDFQSSGPVHLTGLWEFYWNRLLYPEDFRGTSEESDRESSRQTAEYVRVPSSWNRFDEKPKRRPADGFATYRLTVYLSDDTSPLYIEFPEQSSAFRCYINGSLVHEAGIVGKNREATTAQFLPAARPVHPADGLLEIVMHISNFQHREGGLSAPLLLGTENHIIKKRDMQLSVDAFLLGAIILIAIYHFVLFCVRKEEKAMLFFSLFCITIAARLAVTGDYLIMHLVPAFPWAVLKKIEFIAEPVSVVFFTSFLANLYPSEFDRIIKRILQFGGTGYAVLSLVLPVGVMIDTALVSSILVSFLGAYSIFVIARAIFRKRTGAVTFLFGILSLLFGALYDITSTMLDSYAVDMFPFMLIVFFVSQSILLSKRFAGAFVKAEYQLENFLLTLASAIESKDRYTGGHVERVANYVRDLAQSAGITPEEQRRMYLGAIIHDIGKLGIKDDLLNKPAKLSREEFEIIKSHTTKGKELLEKIEDVETAAEITLFHQERWDGQGYPYGLSGEDIPLPARLTALADYWDAIITDRPYRKAMPLEKALDIMYNERGKAFDPYLFDIFMKERIFLYYLTPGQKQEYNRLKK